MADRAEAAARYFAAHAAEWDQIRSLHVADAQVEEAIRDALGDGAIGHLVDIGTGTGRVLEALGPKVEQAVGIDLSMGQQLGLLAIPGLVRGRGRRAVAVAP